MKLRSFWAGTALFAVLGLFSSAGAQPGAVPADVERNFANHKTTADQKYGECFFLSKKYADEHPEVVRMLTVLAEAQKVDKDPLKGPGAGKFQLGRAKPKKQYDYGRFRAVVGQDGKTRFFARLGKNIDLGKRKTDLPVSVDWSVKGPNVLKHMYLNDQYGDCVIASRYHQVGFQTAADTGTGVEGLDTEVYSAYQSACGRGDNGCDMSAVNQYQQSVGLKFNGVVHKTDGSVAIDNTNKDIVMSAIYTFGGINVGMSLPNDWYQSADGSDWGITNSQIVGGHEVQAYGYDDKGVWIATWGGKRRILWAAYLSTQWIDETYTTLSADWYGSDKMSPVGLDATTLKADLALIAGGTIPPLPGPAPGPPNPPNPTPGTGFTGSLVTTQQYVDGVASGPPVLSLGAAPGGIEADLKAAGVDPKVTADIMKLLADLKAKASAKVITADIVAILTDFTTTAADPKADSRLSVPRGERDIRREDPVACCGMAP